MIAPMYWLFAIGAVGFLALHGASLQASDSSPQDPDWIRFDSSFQRIANIWGLNWQWLKAIALNESNLGRNERVANGQTSYDGLSWGLMQVTLATAKRIDPNATPALLAQLSPNADYSINLAAQILLSNMSEFDSNDPRFLEWVIKRYNGSSHAVQNQIDGVPNGLNSRGEDIDSLLNQYWARFQQNLASVQS